METISEIVASRNFNMAYVWMDTAFLILLVILLLLQKKRLCLLWTLTGGILYLLVDFGIFYLATGSRSVYVGGQLCGWVGTLGILTWMSMSYGMTNFAWIWLAMRHDAHLKEYTVLIMGWWIACPMLSQMFTGSAAVQTVRTTGAYHGVMGLILFVSYLIVIVYNMFQKDKELRFRILWLCVIGIAVQFGWEFALLIGDIRSQAMDMTFEEKLRTLVVNSLVETNLGMPGCYLIFLAVTAKWTETLKRKHETFEKTIRKNNRMGWRCSND